MSTVSTKQTERHGSRCDACGLWFLYLHPGADGRFLCAVCAVLAYDGAARAEPAGDMRIILPASSEGEPVM